MSSGLAETPRERALIKTAMPLVAYSVSEGHKQYQFLSEAHFEFVEAYLLAYANI